MDSTAPKLAELEAGTEPCTHTQETADPKPKVTDSDDPWSYNKDTRPDDVPLALMPKLIGLVNADDPGKQLQGAMVIRKILSVDPVAAKDKEDSPFDAVMASGVVPRFVDLLRCDECTDLQLQCSWALTNLCADAHLPAVVEMGVVPRFIRLLDSPSDAVREQAAWGLGNIASENATTRDLVFAEGAMQPLLRCASSDTLCVARNGVWAVSNLCRGKPSPKLDAVAPALPVLVPLLAHPDEEVVTDACWAISYISTGKAERVESMLNAGALPQIVNLLSSGVDSHVTPALRTLGNVASGTMHQVEQLASNGALPFFHDLLKHQRRAIRKEACWTLSNIAADTTDMIQAVIDTELLPLIIECMGAAEFQVKTEALWCVANITTCGSAAHVRYLVEDLRVFHHLIELLGHSSPKLVSVTLETVENILEGGRSDDVTENAYVKEFLGCGGLDPLISLKDSTNDDVATRASAIVRLTTQHYE